MKELYTLLPGGDLWGPYLEQSPVSPTELVDHPLKTLRGFFPAELGDVLREAVGGYAQVLLFLILSAVIALLLGERADGTLLDLVCAGGCGVLLWEKLVALSDEFCVQIESWNRFLLGFLPVYAGVLTLGGESAAGASASGFFLTLLCFLAQGLAAVVPPLLQCYLALSMACCVSTEAGLSGFCRALGGFLQKLLRWAGKLLAALLGLQRLSAWQLDRAALRTGQLLTGTIPIVGETLSDASEAVLASVQLLKSGLGLAALLTIAAEFIPVYLGMLVQLGLLSGCGVLCSLTGNARGQELLGCFAEAVRCMMAVTALFAGLAVVGTALLFVVGGGRGAWTQGGDGGFLHGVYLRGTGGTNYRERLGPAGYKSGGRAIYFSSGASCASTAQGGRQRVFASHSFFGRAWNVGTGCIGSDTNAVGAGLGRALPAGGWRLCRGRAFPAFRIG